MDLDERVEVEVGGLACGIDQRVGVPARAGESGRQQIPLGIQVAAVITDRFRAKGKGRLGFRGVMGRAHRHIQPTGCLVHQVPPVQAGGVGSGEPCVVPPS